MIKNTGEILNFSFWTPVVFPKAKVAPGGNFITKMACLLGSLADQYLYVGRETLVTQAEPIENGRYYFKGKKELGISLWKTALKISSFVIALLILPEFLVAAAISKTIWKVFLNCTLPLLRRSPNEVVTEKMIGKTRVVLLTGDLLIETTDAIVNPANKNLRAGGGVCGFINQFAKKGVFDECDEILKKQKRKDVQCGEAVITTAGELPSKIKAIVHVPGPKCSDKKEDDDRANLLTAAYTNALEILVKPQDHKTHISEKLKPQPLRSISFPAISVGIFEYPAAESATVAFAAIKDFIEKNPGTLDEVRIVCRENDRDRKTNELIWECYQKALDDLQIA